MNIIPKLFISGSKEQHNITPSTLLCRFCQLPLTINQRMTEACIRTAVEAIHSSPYQTVLYLAGGASQVLGLLLSVPGASNTVLEAVVPYSRMSLIQLLGKVLSFSSSISSLSNPLLLAFLLFIAFLSLVQIPSQFCSQQTAEDMALLAYNRALKLSSPGCFTDPNLNLFYLLL